MADNPLIAQVMAETNSSEMDNKHSSEVKPCKVVVVEGALANNYIE